MRKTKLIKERCTTLRKMTSAIESVWMRHLGYYTYQLFFKDAETADSKISMIAEKYPNSWVENIGYIEMECEDEFTPQFWVKGHVLEVTFLD